MLKRAAFVLFSVLIVSSPASAQEPPTKTPVDHKNSLSTAPISDLLGFLNAEYQRKINDSVTLGISGGTFELDDDDFSNLMAIARYYPQGAALTGFFVGARAGIHAVSEFEFDPGRFEGREVRRTRPAIGIDVGYDWLLGKKRQFYIGVGAGGVRLLGDTDRFDLDAYPTARLNVGFAF